MNPPPISDEHINAFVDGDLGAKERDEMFALAAADPAIERRVAEARRTKALLAHAYDVAPPPAAPRGFPYAAALASFIVAVALAIGGAAWMLRDAGAAGGVVIQVADADPAKWQLAIEQARVALAETPRHIDVVVIAYGPGLPMLEANSAVLAQIKDSHAEGIRFLACGNTMERQNVQRAGLAPGVDVALAGAMVEVVRLQRLGYAYVRI